MRLRGERKTFLRPPMKNRPLAFWMINDALDEDRMIEQFDALMDGGMGGVVLHADERMPADSYLSEPWFDALATLLKRARKRNARIMIHDEHGWPSGKAGGRIPRDYPDLGMAFLVMEDLRLTEDTVGGDLLEDSIAAFMVPRDDPTQGVQRKANGAVALAPDRPRILPVLFDFKLSQWIGERLLVFRERRSREHVNYLSADCTKAFLQLAYTPYYEHVRRHFGHALSNMFMADVELDSEPASLPWDTEFEALFLETRGYSLIPYLPALFFDIPDCERVRYDYWTLVAEMIREGFSSPVKTWCADHRVPSTGHYAYQSSLRETVRQLGSMMPLHADQDLPGIDLRGTDVYSRRFDDTLYGQALVAIKQVVSVARQLDKEGALSESFAMAGHGLSVERMQSIALFQLALGITDFVYHGAFYSIRGDRKLDSSPILGPQQPYWPHLQKHFDAIGRGAWLMSQGQSCAEVLMLHPASSMQATYRHARTQEECGLGRADAVPVMPFEILDRHFTALSSALIDAQIDFDYGDEEILAAHARTEQKSILVGNRRYSIVLLPPLVNLRLTTLELLRDFATAGGIVVAVGSAIRLIDGRPSSEGAAFLEEYGARIVDGVEHFDYTEVVKKLVAVNGRTLELESEDREHLKSIKVQRRAWEDRVVLFTANISREPISARLRCILPIDGVVEEWDLSTGTTKPVAKCSSDGATEFDVHWAPSQAHVYVAIPNRKEGAIQTPRWSYTRHVQAHWHGRRVESNTLPLIECSFARDQRFSISQARNELFKQIKRAGGQLRVTTRWPFHVSPIIPWTDSCHMIVELPLEAELLLNGEPLYLGLKTETMDPSMTFINLPELRLGKNVLEMSGIYTDPRSLESPWLQGDFRVATDDRRNFQIEFGAGSIAFGSWPAIGLPFFAGSVVYHTSVEDTALGPGDRILLKFSALQGAALVRLNGATVDRIPWPPYEVDLTATWNASKSIIEIEVANTLRNLMGPHFEPDEERKSGFYRTSYEGEPGDEFHFEDYGLLAAPEIVIEKREE